MMIYQQDSFKLDASRITDEKDPYHGDMTVFHDVVIASEIVQPYEDGKAYKPREELEQYAWTANGRWVTLGAHPEEGIISDRNQVSGRTVNSHYVKDLIDPKTKRPNRSGVRADVQIFNNKVTPTLLEDMKNGKKQDVSIGFFFTKDETVGAVTDGPFKGEEYDYVQRNMFHDHLAAGIDNGRCPAPYCGLGADEIGDKLTGDPFAGFSSFNDCVTKVMEKNPKLSEESAKKICYDEETEVLTEDGWKLFSDLTLKDKIMTLNPETEEIEYHIPENIIGIKYNGEMIHFKGSQYDLLVTPDHQMYCTRYNPEKPYDFYSALDVSNMSNAKLKKHGKWVGKHQDSVIIEFLPEVKILKEQYDLALKLHESGVSLEEIIEEVGNPKAKYWIEDNTNPLYIYKNSLIREISIDDYLKFMGWYLSEGCSYDGDRAHTVSISQSKTTNPKYYDEIVVLIEKMGFNAYKGKDVIAFSSKQLVSYLKEFGLAGDKFVPKIIKTLPPEKIEIFLDALFKGDGRFRDGRFQSYTSISSKLLDDVQELLIKTGKNGSVKHPYLSINTRQLEPIITKKATIEDYDGIVYDVTIPNHILMVRRNGKAVWSGNCGKLKSENESKDVEKDAMGKLAQKLTQMFMDELEELKGMKDAIKDEKKEWYTSITWKDEPFLTIFDVLDEEIQRILTEEGLCPHCDEKKEEKTEEKCEEGYEKNEEGECVETKKEKQDSLGSDMTVEEINVKLEELKKRRDEIRESARKIEDELYSDSPSEKKRKATLRDEVNQLWDEMSDIGDEIYAYSQAKSMKIVQGALSDTVDPPKKDKLDPYEVLRRADKALSS